MNARGQYGNTSYERHRALVGQGSYFGHTPGEVEDELDQLHNEIMAFGQQLLVLANKSEAQRIQQRGGADLRKIEEEYQALRKLEETFLPLVREVDHIKEKLVANPTSPAILLELRDAHLRLNKVLVPDKRKEVVLRLRSLAEKRAEAQRKIISEGASSLELWEQDVWTPFFNSWMKFRELKKKPAQTWPLSGTWDRIQEYRQQFVDLYDRAPFKPSGPRPLDPKGRKDPSLFGDARSILKWGLIGALGIGGVVAVSVIVSKIKKGRGS